MESKSGSKKSPSISIEMKIGLVLFAVLFLTYGFFPQNFRSENVISRMALTLSILEKGTLTINNFQDQTKDIAFYNGNYYTDKAPGMSLSALPVAALVRLTRMVGNNDGATLRNRRLTRNYRMIVYWTTLFTSGLATALAALAIYRLSLRIGASLAGAIFATLAYGLATPAWGWASAFFGHALASACLFLGFVAVFALVNGSPGSKWNLGIAFLAGALLAWTVVVEFIALPAVVIVIVYGILSARHWRRDRIIRALVGVAIGGVLFSLPLFVYNTLAFGSPFRVGYGNVPGFEGMQQGFFGLTYPQLGILYNLILPQYRGILWVAPVLLAVPFAYYSLWQFGKHRGLLVVLILVPLAYLLINASYFYWDGGGSTGPRHLTPALAFLCLPLGILWTRAHPTVKPVLLGLLFLSFQIAFISAAVDITSPSDYDKPLFEYLIPKFLQGDLLSPPFIRGLNGYLILIPLFLIWGVGYILIRRYYIQPTGGA
jgi:hypothetical protein